MANSSKKSSKSALWKKLEADARITVDGIGYPIDKGIMPVVVGLWAHGVATMASCEGHLDHGRHYPWVDMEVQPPNEWGLWNEWKGDETKRKIMRRKNLVETAKALKLLNEFYRDRSMEHQDRLILNDVNMLWGTSEIIVMGSPLPVKTKMQKMRALKKARKEMNAFARFLKTKFLNN